MSRKTPRLSERSFLGIRVRTKWQSSMTIGDDANRGIKGNRHVGNDLVPPMGKPTGPKPQCLPKKLPLVILHNSELYKAFTSSVDKVNAEFCLILSESISILMKLV
ncbi:hypothetical protein BHU72_02405 [Desulfuribacillus stibiiarsenatis]|uniref:Uncharacterized protein n=1 Tax=Desulfuribacillus stibiiarsenatis TaxID=1390249 RepID=A0A1E5L6J0_9FIRM|nr:hypothetical protein BHU72_02405 [Desulfuribacillus stibiiarsenatis]